VAWKLATGFLKIQLSASIVAKKSSDYSGPSVLFLPATKMLGFARQLPNPYSRIATFPALTSLYGMLRLAYQQPNLPFLGKACLATLALGIRRAS
jgi:hypothetical protein